MSDIVHPLALLLPRNRHLIRKPQAPVVPAGRMAWGTSPVMKGLMAAEMDFYADDDLAAWKKYHHDLANLGPMRLNFAVVHIVVPWLVAGWLWTIVTDNPWPIISALIVGLAGGFILLRSFNYFCHWTRHAGMVGVSYMIDEANSLAMRPELYDAAGRAMYQVYRECLVARRGRHRLNPAAAILHLTWPLVSSLPQDLMIAYTPPAA